MSHYVSAHDSLASAHMTADILDPDAEQLLLQGCEWVNDHGILQAGLGCLRQVDLSYTAIGDGTLATLSTVSAALSCSLCWVPSGLAHSTWCCRPALTWSSSRWPAASGICGFAGPGRRGACKAFATHDLACE